MSNIGLNDILQAHTILRAHLFIDLLTLVHFDGSIFLGVIRNYLYQKGL